LQPLCSRCRHGYAAPGIFWVTTLSRLRIHPCDDHGDASEVSIITSSDNSTVCLQNSHTKQHPHNRAKSLVAEAWHWRWHATEMFLMEKASFSFGAQSTEHACRWSSGGGYGSLACLACTEYPVATEPHLYFSLGLCRASMIAFVL
jgi:hypothetical protein